MLGLIGGTGLGDALFGEAFGREHVVETPFGAPSSRVRVLEWSGLEIAVLSRHGEGHLLAPSQVPYRANVFALKALGVTHLIVSGAVGSLREEYRPKDLVSSTREFILKIIWLGLPSLRWAISLSISPSIFRLRLMGATMSLA